MLIIIHSRIKTEIHQKLFVLIIYVLQFARNRKIWIHGEWGATRSVNCRELFTKTSWSVFLQL